MTTKQQHNPLWIDGWMCGGYGLHSNRETVKQRDTHCARFAPPRDPRDRFRYQSPLQFRSVDDVHMMMMVSLSCIPVA